MRQDLFVDVGISDDSFASVTATWQGGHGWLVVRAFTQSVGNPYLSLLTDVLLGSTPQPIPGIPATITAAGIYPFYAPAGVAIRAAAQQTAAGDLGSCGNVYLLGDKAA
jgi:hypothetical protein